MMRKENIKAGNLFSVSGNYKLLVLLCFFIFPLSLLSQIFYGNDTKIFIGDETVITQKFLQIKKIDFTHIYIASETTITGLQPDQNITVIYLDEPEKTKEVLAKKHFKQEKRIANHTPIEEESIFPKEVFKQNDNQKTFFLSDCHSIAVAPTTTQDIKQPALQSEEVKYVHHKAAPHKLAFEKTNLLLLSVCLTVNKIRPPPFVKKIEFISTG